MHVLIDSLRWGGAEGLLADFVVGARAAGVHVTVAHLGGDSGMAHRLHSLGVEPVHVPIGGLVGHSDRRLVRRHLAETAPDLLHTHLAYSDFLGGVAARNLGIPAVSTLHVMEWGGSPRERVKAHVIARARRHCMARVLAVSEAARMRYLEHRWDRPQHVLTVHNGIVDRRRPGSGKRLRAELGIGPTELLISMIGVLRAAKGHDIAISAVKALRSRVPHLRLLIAGDGPDAAKVETLAKAAAGTATLLGYREDVFELLDASDLVIQPSRVDAFPTSLLEAMAAGVPAVASATGGIPEIVQDGKTGLLVDPSPGPEDLVDALEPLLQEPLLRQRMGRLARTCFEGRFSVEKWMERLMPVYEAALARR